MSLSLSLLYILYLRVYVCLLYRSLSLCVSFPSHVVALAIDSSWHGVTVVTYRSRLLCVYMMLLLLVVIARICSLSDVYQTLKYVNVITLYAWYSTKLYLLKSRTKLTLNSSQVTSQWNIIKFLESLVISSRYRLSRFSFTN